MIGLIFLLTIGFQQPVEVGELPERNYQKDGGFFSDDEIIFYVTKRYVHGWNDQLEKVVEFKLPDGKIDAFFCHNQRIMITTYDGESGGPKTQFLNYQGEVLGELDLFGSQIQMLDGQLYLFRLGLESPHINVPYPYQYQPIQILESNDGYRFDTEGQPLFKFTPHQAKFQFDFKDSWAVFKNDTYYFVNEIEPQVWIGTLSEIAREQKAGATKPGNLPSIPLNLKGFSPILKPFSPGKGIFRSEEVQKIRWQWWAKHSQIVGFQAYGDGFLVAYEYPQCDEETGECQEALLGLQKFDHEFQPIGEPATFPGLLLGTIGPKAYILQFEKPLTPKKPIGPFQVSILALDSL